MKDLAEKWAMEHALVMNRNGRPLFEDLEKAYIAGFKEAVRQASKLVRDDKERIGNWKRVEALGRPLVSEE